MVPEEFSCRSIGNILQDVWKDPIPQMWHSRSQRSRRCLVPVWPWKGKLKKGDVLVSNHPMYGGTHLPDITVITPAFSGDKIVFYVASRAHHADIGGILPGSMPPMSRELFQEGAAIKSEKLVSEGKFNEEEAKRGSRCHADWTYQNDVRATAVKRLIVFACLLRNARSAQIHRSMWLYRSVRTWILVHS